MLTWTANGDSRLSRWLRVREFAVPASMIETATARRRAGDWAGACAAAGVDIDFGLRHLSRTHGQELVARVRADLRHLAPDLLRWHLPRIAPDGLLRPGLTIELARYETEGCDGDRPVHLVARTPPAWADAGQRISLALWDGSHSEAAACGPPHPHPHRRFRLDLHRHLWDARRADELRVRSGADGMPADVLDLTGLVPPEYRCAVDRWAAEAAILLRAEGRTAGAVGVRLGARHRLVLELAAGRDGPGPPALRIAPAAPDRGAHPLPVLPDAATWVLPDLDLLRAGLIEADRLHPLVASALVPDHSLTGPSHRPDRAGQPQLVECRGARHRIGLVDGVLAALDHDPAEIRREELLATLSGTPLPCLQAIDVAHRHPDCLVGVRERLDHGDTAGALAVVEGLLGPEALLRSGDLRDELETAALRRVTYGLFRAGLVGPGTGPLRGRSDRRRTAGRRSRSRHALTH
ncbi:MULTISPECIES: hypothetical protein [unclassified Kitasatospora]|uniref:hypothetical protein n=1 Tax=unclassified Kitasatospora TaxID=2633591 RepID=UPI00070D4110|nr:MULTISPECIES: hypothetical protein [unclassified Kitasatospora]KQV09818.1 hypothetical protein ASC99_10395 [Kitasatospora sp. Root107]KRB70056.1 hypothetical protein ASE03_25740 [Kitasatospora sp. Root187]